MRVIELHKSVTESNDRDAEVLRQELKEKGIFLINIMSSAGSGKTTFLAKTIEMLEDRSKVAVLECDIDSDVDARTIARETGVRSIQLHTGGMCHLTAAMTRQGLEGLTEDELDLAVLENVGNLVCPAEFDTGAEINVNILSVPEGDDKPLKYPLMYQVCNVVIINKIDTMSVFDFDLERAKENIRMRNTDAKIFPISAKTGEGLDELMDELEKYAGEGPHFFPDDMITDQPERQICAELVREKLLRCIDKEIPHGTAVEVTRFTERENGIIDLEVTIYCEKESHKGIIIGKKGAMLKKIGELAREDIEEFMGTKVYLQTWVKVKENWRDSMASLRNFGFTDQ